MAVATDESEVAGAERCNNQNGGSGGNKRSFTDSLLKISTLCLYKMRWYHVLRGEVHKKYVHQIIG